LEIEQSDTTFYLQDLIHHDSGWVYFAKAHDSKGVFDGEMGIKQGQGLPSRIDETTNELIISISEEEELGRATMVEPKAGA
jgi:hypothetical protein